MAAVAALVAARLPVVVVNPRQVRDFAKATGQLAKTDRLDARDVESSLCVMLLMLQSANRDTQDSLKMFQDRGDVHGFFPPEGEQQAHAAEYRAQMDSVSALPGARELLAALTDAGVRWAIATSGYAATARPALALLGLPEDTPMITRDLVRHAKPDPDLFLTAAAQLNVPIEHTVVVGDSIWDMLAAARCRSLGVGLLSGGYGSDELERAGALRVYDDPADLLWHLDEIAARP